MGLDERSGTLGEVVRHLVELLEERPEILDAYLFGSTARGTRSPMADIDVAVFVDFDAVSPSGFGYQADLTAALMAGLGRNDVDVVVLNRAPPLLYHRVLRDGIRLVARDLRATTTREGRALSRYCDWLPQLAKLDAIRRNSLEREGAGR